MEPTFKPYNQHQLSFLPIDFDSVIPSNHMVRLVDRAIESMATKPLIAQYPGGGSSAYNPVMMLKVLVYAYLDKIYTSRRIAKATRENINFMWLTGNVQLDHMTVNRFRSERLKGIIDDIFAEVIALLMKEGYIKFESYFLDGTKIEANANKYSWVWSKNTKRYKEALKKQVREHLAAIELLERDENAEFGSGDLPELGNGTPINSDSIRKAVAKIDEKLATAAQDKKLERAKKVLEKEYLPKMEKYEKQEEIFNGRNSYSKTDTDATFMYMKEDGEGNGNPKPGYNVMMGTENQFITGFSIHQNAGDTTCMKPHLEQIKGLHGKLPNSVTTDAGFGSEENYEYLEGEKIEHFVKYNTFHKEQSVAWKNEPTRVQNWAYEQERDEYICANNQHLVFVREEKSQSETGYESSVRIYESRDCSGCPYREKCIKSDRPDAKRKLYINRRLNELKAIAKTNLNSEKGILMRKKRSVEVESVFGDIKGNFGVRRFLLRGLERVKIEWGLYSIGHNMRKWAALAG